MALSNKLYEIIRNEGALPILILEGSSEATRRRWRDEQLALLNVARLSALFVHLNASHQQNACNPFSCRCFCYYGHRDPAAAAAAAERSPIRRGGGLHQHHEEQDEPRLLLQEEEASCSVLFCPEASRTTASAIFSCGSQGRLTRKADQVVAVAAAANPRLLAKEPVQQGTFSLVGVYGLVHSLCCALRPPKGGRHRWYHHP